MSGTLARMREELLATSLRDLVGGVVRAVMDNGLLTYASAIAFQLLFATIPLLLFAFGLLGGLGLDETWTEDLAPDVRDSTSAPAFAVIDDTVRRVLGERQGFWMTIGAVIAIWKMSSGMRAVMGALDRIYGCEDDRSWARQVVVSIALGLAVGALVLLAAAVAIALPLLLGGPLSLLRFPVAVLPLLAAIYVLVHFAPARPRPFKWVSFGSLLAVAAWLGTSALFGWYVTSIADYGSVFGALTVVIVALEYLFLAAMAFLVGVQVDSLARDRVERSY